MPRVSHTQYELIFPDEEYDPQYFDSKAEAIREARKYRSDGVDVELIASTRTWSHEAAVGHLPPIDITDKPIRFAAADIDLKPTEQMASNAARGLELREKHGKGGTAVGVARARDIKNRANLSPSTVRRMHSFFSRHAGNEKGGEDDAGYIAFMLWGGAAGREWAESKSAQLDKSESARFAAHNIKLPKGKQRLNIDEATAALAQMGYRLGNIRFDPKVGGSVYKVTQPNGVVSDMTTKQITDMVYKATSARAGAKARFAKLSEHMAHIVSTCDKVLAVVYREAPDKSLGGVWARVAQDLHEIKATAHQIARQSWAYSRTGAKARFGQVSAMLAQIESQATDQRDLAKSNLRKLAAKIADIDHTREEWDRYVQVAKTLGYTESQIAGFSRPAAKSRFEKSDEYAAILMKPITVANCGRMMKVAAETMKYAKSVGDDDLFELAEEVGHECQATKSRASRKDAQ